MKCYVFFGIQGSGKGTQAEILSAELHFQHVNVGDLFRNQVAGQTPLGMKVKEIISRGELVPDDLVFEIVDATLEPDCQGIVFDGFPRTLNQAEYLVRHFQVCQVFFLELDEEEAIRRISSRRVCSACGTNYNLSSNPPSVPDVCDSCQGSLIIRNDDRPEAISKRLKEFYEQTLVLTDFFHARELLTRINAGKGIQEVSNQIREIVGNL